MQFAESPINFGAIAIWQLIIHDASFLVMVFDWLQIPRRMSRLIQDIRVGQIGRSVQGDFE